MNQATKLSYLSEKKKLFFLFIKILLIFPASGQNYFELKFGSALDDRARAVQQLADGSIYVAGFSNAGPHGGYDIMLTKLSPSGNILWTQYYGKNLDEYLLFMNKTSDNALILCGESHSSFTGVDAWIMKIDSSGSVVWSNGISTMVNESFKYIEETADGGFIMCGFQSDSSGSNDILVVKTDSLGDIIWEKTYGGADNDYADAVKQTSDGGYLVSADTWSFGLPNYDIYMLKIDSAGNFEWDNFSGGPYADGCQGFIITQDKGYFTFGESYDDPTLPYQYFLQLADSMGNVIWEMYMGGAGSDAAFSAVETSDGFLVTGYSNSHDTLSPIDLVLIKINKQGDSLWSQYYGGPGIDIGYHIIDCLGGGYIIAGTTWHNDNDFYLLKTNDMGLVSTTDKIFSSSLKIYPNPSKGMINVELPQIVNNPHITIFSVAGIHYYYEQFKGKVSELTLQPDLAPGIYILNLTGDAKTYRSVLVVD